MLAHTVNDSKWPFVKVFSKAKEKKNIRQNRENLLHMYNIFYFCFSFISFSQLWSSFIYERRKKNSQDSESVCCLVKRISNKRFIYFSSIREKKLMRTKEEIYAEHNSHSKWWLVSSCPVNEHSSRLPRTISIKRRLNIEDKKLENKKLCEISFYN